MNNSNHDKPLPSAHCNTQVLESGVPSLEQPTIAAVVEEQETAATKLTAIHKVQRLLANYQAAIVSGKFRSTCVRLNNPAANDNRLQEQIKAILKAKGWQFKSNAVSSEISLFPDVDVTPAKEYSEKELAGIPSSESLKPFFERWLPQSKPWLNF